MALTSGMPNAPHLGRATYVALAVVTMAAGFFVHMHGKPLGLVARDVIGDALWAAMIAWWAGALAPSAQLAVRSTVALAICFAVEASQLYHAPSIDAVRHTFVGHLLLGSGFDPRDLAAYAAGIAGAILLELALVARAIRDPRSTLGR